MKKSLLLIIAALAMLSATAQTLNVCQGSVTYGFAAAQTGTMTYTNSGKQLTILEKTFNISEIEKIYVDAASVADNTVNIVYNGTSVSVYVAGNIAKHITTTVSGANVAILQSKDVSEEITYTLSGASANGSFYMDGELKATVVLSSLTLTSADSAAINIRNGKRIAIELAGTSTLADAAAGSQKACMMVNGHGEFTGSGTLNITGNLKHAFWGDEYVLMKKKMTGTINILGAVKDGMNINQYFEQKGGIINISGVGDDGIQVSKTDDDTDEQNGEIIISGGTMNIAVTAAAAKGIKAEGNITITDGIQTITTTGNGIYDSSDKDTKASACIKSDANIAVSGGTMTLNSTGSGGKGINCDSTLTISGGNINVKTSGNRYNYSSSLHSSPKGIKSGGNMIISGGEVSVTLSGTGDGCEAIESKAQITINGGYVYAYSYDDAINSAHDFIINDGYVFARGTNNDGIDANRNIYINGGNVIAVGGSRPENAIDAAEGYNIYINGGNVFGIGGSTAATASASKQASIAFTSSVSGKKLGLFDSNGNGLMYIEVPVTSCTAVYMTANGMAANGKYTIKSGVTVSGGETWNGINTTGTISGGSSLTTATAAAQVGSSMGGGGRPW
jgi:hypothetical protein